MYSSLKHLHDLSWYQSYTKSSGLIDPMASSSNLSVASNTFPNVSHIVSIKLDNGNYIRWLMQIEPVLKANELLGIVDGKKSCPPIQVPASADKDEQVPNPAYSL
jgi:hypothetical protein